VPGPAATEPIESPIATQKPDEAVLDRLIQPKPTEETEKTESPGPSATDD
jgi:hypothetical protein